MAVDDEILWRNPFTFEMKEALLNDSVRRETLMNKKYMKFVMEKSSLFMDRKKRMDLWLKLEIRQ